MALGSHTVEKSLPGDVRQQIGGNNCADRLPLAFNGCDERAEGATELDELDRCV